MTVRQLIDELSNIEDKNLPVGFSAEDRGTYSIVEVIADTMNIPEPSKWGGHDWKKKPAIILYHD